MITKESSREAIRQALDISDVVDTYPGKVDVLDLKEELETTGHLLVVRGDLAYSDKVGIKGNPKFWLYENLLNSERIQKELKQHPDFDLFDGVGLSGLEALGWHSHNIGRKAVLVMAQEHEGSQKFPKDILNRYNLEVITGEKPGEEGYVKKQAEIIRKRKNIIPLHQALYGARCLAPIGNKVVRQLEQMSIVPDETFWVCAGGSNLYGLGTKIKNRFGSRIILVEPIRKRTIDKNLDLSNSRAVQKYARNRLKRYNLDGWDGKFDPEEFPLHARHPNRYLLINWENTGYTGIDAVIGVNKKSRKSVEKKLRKISPEYSWTGTTYLALAPAIEEAKKGKNIVVMAYGKRLEEE